MKESRIFQNARWIIGCKIAQSVLQLLIGMVTARYLGPANYGLISYAASIAAFAIPIMRLGFDAILVSELVSDPKREGEILGTALALNLLSGAGCVAGVFLFVSLANPGEGLTILVCLLYSLSILCAAVEMVQYWYQYKLLSKYPSLVMLACYALVSAYKIFLLVTRKNVCWFALSHAIEYGLIGLSLLVLYRRLGTQKLGFSAARARAMLRRSKYYVVASMMTVVIQNTDHIMLTGLIGAAENGIYAAAMTSVAMFQFVFTAITDSFRPYILSKKGGDEDAYRQNLMRLYSIIFYLSLAQAVGFAVMARPVVLILYGPGYLTAAPLLRLLGIYFIFSAMGLVRNVWVLAEWKQQYLWIINLSGAALNVGLNFLMIPRWGAWGAGLASVLTQIFSNFLLGFAIPALRENNRLLLQAASPRFFQREAGSILKLMLKKE